MDEYMNRETERWTNWQDDKHDRKQDEQTKRTSDRSADSCS